MINEEKRKLRDKIRAKRKAIPADRRLYLSERMMAKLAREPFFDTDEVTFLYVSMPEEVQLYGLIEFMLDTGRKLAVPFISEKDKMTVVELNSMEDLEEDKYGILTIREDKRREISPAAIGLVIVPGVAFTESGDRLGMGGGYYDRFLRETQPEAYRVALAFDMQIVDEIPTAEHDEKVNFIITESRTIPITRYRKDEFFCKGNIL